MHTAQTLPDAAEIFSLKALAARHPHLLSESRLKWAARNRRKNGLLDRRAIYESPTGELLFHEPKVLEWLLGLGGRAKPRVLRTRRDAAREARLG